MHRTEEVALCGNTAEWAYLLWKDPSLIVCPFMTYVSARIRSNDL